MSREMLNRLFPNEPDWKLLERTLQCSLDVAINEFSQHPSAGKVSDIGIWCDHENGVFEFSICTAEYAEADSRSARQESIRKINKHLGPWNSRFTAFWLRNEIGSPMPAVFPHNTSRFEFPKISTVRSDSWLEFADWLFENQSAFESFESEGIVADETTYGRYLKGRATMLAWQAFDYCCSEKRLHDLNSSDVVRLSISFVDEANLSILRYYEND
ncbi:MAG: hypothetical protein AAFP90_17225 [Planctomycetota bacterium]